MLGVFSKEGKTKYKKIKGTEGKQGEVNDAINFPFKYLIFIYLQLLDSCLKSPLLPGYLAASFAKKLSRLALTVPPSGSIVIIALIHNLLRRHPSVNCLVHQEDDNESTTKSGIDPFNNEETDLLKTNAMRSSLWEIDTLRHHYCPPMSRFVLSLENDLTVRSKTTEVAVKDFSSGSYGTIFKDEVMLYKFRKH
ncbi:hypothetical protein LXL04_014630 [Taraxacum kok-saghyz]